MMTSDALASMYAQIVNGGTKETSKYVTDDESSGLWDSIEREVAEMRDADPNVVFSIPNEMPDSDDDETSGASGDPGDGAEPPAAETPTEDGAEPTDAETTEGTPKP